MSSCTLAPPTPVLPTLPPRHTGRHDPSRAILSSMLRRMGSAMPKVLRSDSMRRFSCVASHDLRRASRGWRDTGAGGVEEDEGTGEAAGFRPWRSTS
ncbi:hypothetical protein RRF57_000467 [Xylaria bambusicola]|uniref:Uncharacterized protein n=1 Tax=Xylaria bambusicola TaxID=326684 RepID=A0AAN7UFR1_9PEZI